MASEVTKRARRGWVIDLIPGAAAFELCSRPHGLGVLGPLGAGAFVFVIGLAACGIAIAASSLLRMWIGRVVPNVSIGKAAGIITSLMLAMVLIFVAAAEPANGSSDVGSSSRGQHDAESQVSNAVSSGSRAIIVTTSAQDASGVTDAAITNEEVGRWAEAFLQQAATDARKSCLSNGGDEHLCGHFGGKETHKVLQVNGRRIAVIHIDAYNGTSLYARIVRTMGLRDGKLVSVGCMRLTAAPLEPTMRPCAQEIVKRLGVRF